VDMVDSRFRFSPAVAIFVLSLDPILDE
jgi:hypothetical protein